VLYLTTRIIHPPSTATREIHERSEVCVHAVKETDGGIYVSGAKVVANRLGADLRHLRGAQRADPGAGSALRLRLHGADERTGVKLISRASYEKYRRRDGHPVRLPALERLDENDANLRARQCLHPWEELHLRRCRPRQQLVPEDGFLRARSSTGTGWRSSSSSSPPVMQALEATAGPGYRGRAGPHRRGDSYQGMKALSSTKIASFSSSRLESGSRTVPSRRRYSRTKRARSA